MLTTLKGRIPSESTGAVQPKRILASEADIVQSPIGVDSFRTLIETRDFQGLPYLFVDKSLFIKEILEDLTVVKLITRPRRFGKTLNMSMLHHFLASEVDGKPTKALFEHLKIGEHKEYLEKYQGKYPVVFMTLKDIVREDNYKAAYKSFCTEMSKVYLKHEYLLSSPKLGPYQKKVFESVLEERATPARIKTSLSDLTQALYLDHGVKPWVLIDEYDTPIQTARAGGYYREMVDFMRGFLGTGLKGNTYLDKAILTGILRVSKESIFSDLNNIKTYSLLHPRYSQYFGFTEPEVLELLEKTELNQNIASVRAWYNGYQFGNSTVYNPWSIINYIQEKGKLSAYWVNMSSNQLIKDLLLQSSTHFKEQFEFLLQNKPVEAFVDEHVTFSLLSNHHLESYDSAIWSLLLMSGYLKATVMEERSQGALCQLQIPNHEVKDLYRVMIVQWLSGANNPVVFNRFIDNLLSGNIEDFATHLKTIMLQSLSVHDIKGKKPEKFFHGFMLGLIAAIDPRQYQIHSNKESGYGRFDIIIAPNDPNKLGIILEIKSLAEAEASSATKIKSNTQTKSKATSKTRANISAESLKEEANKALIQIDERQYAMMLPLQNIKNCLKIGVAFNGKDLAVTHRLDEIQN